MASRFYELPGRDPGELSVTRHDRLHKITWDEAGLSVRASRIDPTRRADLLRHNPQLAFHNYFGYSFGDFHEFFISGVDDDAELDIAGAEVAVGEITPLAMLLFEGDYHRKAHGDEWEYYKATLQISGIPRDDVEAYVLKALDVLEDRSSHPVDLIAFGPVGFWEDPELEELPTKIGAVPLDLEPARFFRRGRREYAHESACLQFYRVLEFYAFFEVQRDIAAIRGDSALTDKQFVTKVAAILYRDEKTPLVRLVERLVGKRLLQRALAKGLITQPTGKSLGEALYEFRNSFVHAKYIQRALIHAPSIFDEDEKSHEWRHVLQNLARAAITKFSRKRKSRRLTTR